MSENHREPEVPEARVPVAECLDGLARITLEELAPIHSVKSGTSRMLVLQVRKWMQILGKSALMHTARLMNSFARGLVHFIFGLVTFFCTFMLLSSMLPSSLSLQIRTRFFSTFCLEPCHVCHIFDLSVQLYSMLNISNSLSFYFHPSVQPSWPLS